MQPVPEPRQPDGRWRSESSHAAGCTLIDVRLRPKGIPLRAAALVMAAGLPFAPMGKTQNAVAPAMEGKVTVSAGPPPSNGGFYPLSQVHRGLVGTAWTVFEGAKPEPMEVEILGVLRGARGPGHD